LQRFRALAEEHEFSLNQARSRSSQAFAQAFACSLLVPILGGALYLLLPSIEARSTLWLGLCSLALFFTLIATLWLFQLVATARWGGLKGAKRLWVLASQCAGERFLALVRAGTPPDLAWGGICDFLGKETPDLALSWGYSIWESAEVNEDKNMKKSKRAEQVIVHAGFAIKKAVQVSLMEGRPCVPRVETALLALRQGIQAQVERELTLLGTEALKPLFVFVAPALMGLLASGIWIAAQEITGGNYFLW
jgi:hypothetical protein